MASNEHQSFETRMEDLFRVAELVPRWKEGLLTLKEAAFIQRWLSEAEVHRTWFESMTEGEIPAEKAESIKDFEARRTEAFSRVSEQIGFLTPSRRRSRNGKAAFGILAILAIASGALYLNHKGTPSTPRPQLSILPPTDILPGTNKATLVLSNGQQVDLDSAHTGVITQQPGNATVTNGGGQLAYASNNAGGVGAVLYNTVNTGKGGQYKLVLSDGTKVWLDASSSLHYPTVFAGKNREVSLTGQGYFEVAHHKEPFIVHTPSVDIQDLGTAFNVKAYAESKVTKATLLQGSIRVTAGTRRETLVPGEQARVTADGAVRVSKGVNTDSVIGWKDGLFIFDHTSLEEGMAEIGRWYDVTIEYAGGKVPDREMLGTAPLHENLSVLVKLLNYSGINCTLDLTNRKIVVQ